MRFPLAASTPFRAADLTTRERTLAVCMSQQARLGSDSALGMLDSAILQVISQYASLHPDVNALAGYLCDVLK